MGQDEVGPWKAQEGGWLLISLCSKVFQVFEQENDIIFFKVLFIWERDRDREIERERLREQGQEREGEAVSPLNRGPDAGLDLRAWGSWAEPKADA